MEHRIMQLHTTMLKFLFLWPIDLLSRKLNSFIMYGCFCISMCCAIPIVSAAGYQFYVGIEDINMLMEALIGVYDIIGNTATYICFLRRQKKIEEIVEDIYGFLKFCGSNTILETDEKNRRYTKYFLGYVTLAVILNLSWPMLSSRNCIDSRGTEFYVKHDPCGMPTQNMYPFDANQKKYFWILYTIEAVYCYHTCCFFSLATATVMGFLKHIIAQLKCCGHQFEHVFDRVEENQLSYFNAQQDFIRLIKYHQLILIYAEKVFKVFDIMIVVYIGVTSFTLAIIGFRIASPATNMEDRIRYTMLLIGWVMLFCSICYYGQQVRDESVKIGDSVYNSKWYEKAVAPMVRSEIIFVVARTKKALNFKVNFLGSISLVVFVAVMKRAYQLFTLLLSATADEA